MGLLNTYCFKTKSKEKWYVHVYREENTKRKIYYLTKETQGAIDLPLGFEVVESPISGIPILRRKSSKREKKE